MDTIKLDEIIKLLESKQNCIVYGPNNSGKTSLLKQISESYIKKNTNALFSGNNSNISPYIIVPAKRVFELQEGGVLPNEESLTIDVMNNFGKEWTTGSYILGVREKIKKSPLGNKVRSMCSHILNVDSVDVFDTHCSDGVQNIVNVLSYVFHILNLYTKSEDIGVVLQAKFLLIIDEIELFLFTKSIVNFLDELFANFKNMNLLISSHSVLVMQRINDFRVLKVENTHSVIDYGASPYFKDFGSILTLLYDIKEYPNDLEKYVNNMDSILKNNEKDQSVLEPIFEEADTLRKKYPNLTELVTNLQNNFYKRFINNAKLKEM